MADICPVCDKKIGFFDERRLAIVKQENQISVHLDCVDEFKRNPEKYGGEAIEDQEQQRQQEEEKALYKSVRIKGGVDINSFDMPFGDMVGFMVKWALASIPAFFILFIIFGIFFAIFGALFF